MSTKQVQTITIVYHIFIEGRDKLCKTIQYGSRIIKYQTADSNKQLAAKFQGLFEGMRDARKLFRLFKSIVEYQKIQQLAAQKAPQHKKILNILSRLGFFFYWIFDNLQILAKVKFLEGVDKEKAGKRAAFFWLMGLLFSIAVTIIQILEVQKEEALLHSEIRAAGSSTDERLLATFRERRINIAKQKFDNTLNLLKNLGDTVTASQALSIPKNWFGFDFNDGQVGFGGLLSAVITCYQLYPAKK